MERTKVLVLAGCILIIALVVIVIGMAAVLFTNESDPDPCSYFNRYILEITYLDTIISATSTIALGNTTATEEILSTTSVTLTGM